ncbi:MAG: HAD family hydrolase [Actinomycetota bacterium]
MSIPKPPRAVTFDCWSTLISDSNWEQTMRRRQEALVSIAGKGGIELTPESAQVLIDAAWQQHVASWRNGGVFGARGAADWIWAQPEMALADDPDHALRDELADRLALAIEDATTGEGTYVLPGAAEAIEAIKRAGVATALVCDIGFTPARFVRKFLPNHNIELDHYFFSDEVGAPKPLPAIFEAALAATGAQPDQAVHIGDLRRTDIAGARNAGMASLRYTGIHDDQWHPEEARGKEADAVLHHWSELPDLLGI